MRKLSCLLTLLIVILIPQKNLFARGNLDPSKYDKNGFVLGQIPLAPVVKKVNSPPKDPTLPPTTTAPKPTINLEAFKQGAPASCFDYYTFGSIAVNLSTDTSKYIPGNPVLLRGQIINNNKYPITHLTIKARMVKDIPNPDYSRSEIITLGDVDIVKDITLKAGGSFNINYSHILPLNAPKGDYQIFFYAYNNDRFNQSGLSFTNDVVASRLNFTVTGNNPQHVYLNQTKIVINDQRHNVMAFMTDHKKDTPIQISLPLVNPSNKTEEMMIRYNLYKWDSLQEKNKVDSKIEMVQVPAQGKILLKYTVNKTDASVYFLKITADNATLKKDTSVYSIKTESNIRFTVSGYDYPRINSFGVNAYPIKANQEATLFTCYHNGASQETITPVTIHTVLYNEKDQVIAETEYDGKITGDIKAIIKKFTPIKDLVNFKTITTLSDDTGKVIDTIENNYNCKDLDPTLCPKPTTIPGISSIKDIPWDYIILILAVILVVFLFLNLRRRKHGNIISSLFFVGILLISSNGFIGTAEAAVRTAPFGITLGSGSAYFNYTGSFHKEFNFVESGINLSDTGENIVNIGEAFTSVISPTTGYWFVQGASTDSPPMDGVVYTKYQTNDIVMSQDGSTDWRMSVSIPIESGTIGITSSNPSVVSCTSSVCTAIGAGTANITVSFPNVAQLSSYAQTCDVFHYTYHSTYGGGFTVNGELENCIDGQHADAGKNAPDWTRVSNSYGYYSDVYYLSTRFDDSFLNHNNMGFGMANVYGYHEFEDFDPFEQSKSVSFSFPSITYNITVPPAPNRPQTVVCNGVNGVTQTNATIHWNYSDPDNDSQTDYQIQILDSSGAIVKNITAPANTDVSSIGNVVVTGLNPGVTYSAQIRVYNNQNAWSQYANGCGSFTTLSNQPQVVTYKTADEITPTSATVHWTYTDPENDPQTEYEVGLSTSSNFISTPFVKIDTGAVTNASFSGLTPDTTYYVRVKAKNDVNGWSAYSTGLFKTTINTINATCGPSSLFVSPNQPVIWTTNASGGTGEYTYSWSGNPAITGTTNSITKSYSTSGIKTASVTITSGSQTDSIDCIPVTVTNDVCNNFEGVQTVVPMGFTVNATGECICPVSPISVALTATPPGPLTAPGSTNLSWTTTGNPTSCDASNYWSGTNITNGSLVTQRTGMTPGTYIFDITCHKPNTPDATSRATVVVNPTTNPTPGTCGGAYGTTLSSAPTTNLCGITGDIPTVSTNSTNYTWTCTGINGGGNVNCNAVRIIPPITTSYNGCFAEGTMTPITPTLADYSTTLINKIQQGEYGYSLSDSARTVKNQTFLTHLSQNISTYITDQYSPSLLTWTSPDVINFTNNSNTAVLIQQPYTHNSSGYYYYQSIMGGKIIIDTSDIVGQKVVFAEGIDVQINGNITYHDPSSSLVIIARKVGSFGGNIFVNPSVTRINATIIADGSLMNGVDGSSKNWINNPTDLMNSLIINGRFLARNTQGGSLNDTLRVRSYPGKCGANSSTIDCLVSTAADQDLERFRLTTNTTGSCTLYVTGIHPIVVDILSSLTF